MKSRRYKYIVLGYHYGAYFVMDHLDGSDKYSEIGVIKAEELLSDSIYVAFSRKYFIGIPKLLICRPMFLFIWGGIHTGASKGIAQHFDFTHRYIGDVLSLHRSKVL